MIIFSQWWDSPYHKRVSEIEQKAVSIGILLLMQIDVLIGLSTDAPQQNKTKTIYFQALHKKRERFKNGKNSWKS